MRTESKSFPIIIFHFNLHNRFIFLDTATQYLYNDNDSVIARSYNVLSDAFNLITIYRESYLVFLFILSLINYNRV